MSIVCEAICDVCGVMEGFAHQDTNLAFEAAIEKGWGEIDTLGLLCQTCLASEEAAERIQREVAARIQRELDEDATGQDQEVFDA